MSQTFDSLIREKRPVQKSHGGVVAEPAPWHKPSPFIGVVMEGLRRRFAKKPDIEKELMIIRDRPVTFEDAIRARSQGYHAAVSDLDYDWQDEDALDNIDLSDLEAWLSGDV